MGEGAHKNRLTKQQQSEGGGGVKKKEKFEQKRNMAVSNDEEEKKGEMWRCVGGGVLMFGRVQALWSAHASER